MAEKHAYSNCPYRQEDRPMMTETKPRSDEENRRIYVRIHREAADIYERKGNLKMAAALRRTADRAERGE
jgi:hypothetical protein